MCEICSCHMTLNPNKEVNQVHFDLGSAHPRSLGDRGVYCCDTENKVKGTCSVKIVTPNKQGYNDVIIDNYAIIKYHKPKKGRYTNLLELNIETGKLVRVVQFVKRIVKNTSCGYFRGYYKVIEDEDPQYFKLIRMS
jgi:hypothetical protein